MKTRKNIARLLSFLMVLSLLLGISAAPVYAVGGEGETASFEIREANGQTGTVQYKLDGSGDFIPANNNTPIDINGVTSITIKAIPNGDAQVNQSNSWISGTEEAVTFDYGALISESGWTYNIQDNDGNITFTIVFDNHDGTGGGSNPGGGGGNPQQPGPSIEFSADSSIEGGTLAVNNGIFTLSKDGSDLGTFSVTLVDSASQETAYTGNEERILLNDISSVKIVMTPAEGMKANLITGGDTPVGALSEPVFNDAGNTYTYTAYPSQFGGEQQFLGVSVWFGEEFVGGDGSDAPVIWDGPQVEHQSDHGFISVKSIEIGSKTYTYQGEGKFAYNGDEIEQLEWYGYNKTSIAEEGGIRVYGDVFTEENVDVFYINFEFNPDYGYQATHVRMTEDDPIPLSDAGFSAAEAIRTFRFAVYPDAHTHFSVIFTATEDIVKANAASISEGGVELAAGELDGGSAVLEVNEANISNQGDFEEAAEGYVVSEYLDISLYNVFYKGNAEDVWSTPVENLDNPAEITLRLEDGIDTDTVKIVHEKGEGDFELLDAEYNPGTQEITFSTSSFSNYAIAYEEQAQDRYFIDFTNAPWTVDGVEVDLEGRESVAELMVWITTEDVIPLTNFDPDTMDAVLIVDEDVTLRLNVDENGNTRLADVDGGVEVLPPYGATLTFAVVAKPGGEGENVYYIDLGTGDWTVGDVTVSAPDGMSGVVPILDTETIPTEMLANFDPETMDITLTVSDGFVIYLEIDENGNTTLVSTRDGVELPPYGETLTFAVVAKPVDNEEFETESYTLTDDKGNVISLTYEKNRELSFTMIDYLAFSPEDLETAGISQEFYDSAMKGIKNATKQHGTLLSFYEILVENDDGFLIHEGPFYIKIKMTDEMKKYDIFKIVYIDVEDNLATESPITLTQEGGYLVGTLEHLSTYALVGDNAPSAPTYTVSFDANGGTGTMVDVTGISGEYTLPENGFTAPDGKQFKAWSVGGVEKAAGDKITVTADTTVIATWENINVSPSNPDNPQTGDNSNLGLWVFLLVLSCCSMIALIVIDKKRKIAK